MALTRPRLGQLTTGVASLGDPITVLHAGASLANVDVGFLINRANGLLSNVALYWNETGNAVVTAFTNNSGTTDSNISVTGYANIITGSHTVYGPILPAANVTYDLGSPSQRFRTLYISGNTIDMGGALISSATSGVTITHNSGSTFTLAAAGAQPTTSNATGAFGNLVVSSGITSTSTSTGALQISGGAGISGNLYVGGNLDVTGTTIFRNIETVNTTEYVNTINATNVYATTIGNIGANVVGIGTYLTSLNASNLSSGTVPLAQLSGITTNQLSASAGITNGQLANNSLTVTAGTGMSGGGAVALGSSVTINNAGVLSITASSGISANATTGSISLTNTGVLAITTSTGISANAATGTIALTNTGVTGLSSSGAGNLTVSSSTGAVTISLPATGPGAVNVGSATSIPTIVTDAQGRVVSLTSNAVSTTVNLTGTSGTGSVSGGGTLTFAGTNGFTATVSGSTITLAESQNLQTTASPTFAGLTTTSSASIGGTATISGATTITNTTTSTTTATGALVVSGGIGVAKDSFFGGNVNIFGNLAVTGQSVSLGSSTLSVQDPIINLHSASDLSPLTSNDGYDIGIKMHYYSGADNAAFIGRANDTGYLEWYSAGTDTSNVFVGTTYGTIKAGEYWAANTTSSTSTTTGALRVAGGAGIVGNVYTNALYTTTGLFWTGNGYPISTGGGGSAAGTTGQLQYNNTGTFGAVPLYYWSGNTNITTTSAVYTGSAYDSGNRVLTGVTITAGTGMSGGGTISGPSGTVTVTNTGVLSISASSGISANVTTGAIALTNTGVTGLSSSGAGNLTVSASTGTITVALPATGPGATTTGSASAIPVITTDAYGRIASISTASVSSTLSLAGTSGTGTVNLTSASLTFAGTNGLTATVSGNTVTVATPQNLQTSASPTFAGGNFTGNVTRSSKPLITNFTGNTAPSSPQQGDEWYYAAGDILYKYVFDGVNYQWIDLTSPLYNASTSATASTLALRDTNGNLTATNFIGVASSAKYADLAEIYKADDNYIAGTVVIFGGEEEITVTNKSHDSRVAGVISTNPAYLMNSECVGLPVAFTGRVPCRVQGPVTKGELLVTSTIPGVAQGIDNTQFVPGCVIGKTLENITTNEIATIEVVVGRF